LNTSNASASADRTEISDELMIARDILVAYLSRHDVDAQALPDLIRQVRLALRKPLGDEAWGHDEADASVHLAPAQPPDSSPDASPSVVYPDYLICLEDGRPYRSMKRLLRARYGLTPEEYRRKWGLPEDSPMVAPSYAAERSLVAKRIGLGKHSKP
jgi:predicted transcriptional regulator